MTDTAERSRRYLAWAILFSGFGAGLLWQAMAGSPLWYHCWQPMFGKISDPVFFCVEDFLALLHPNSWPAVSGSWIFLFTGLIFMLVLTRGKRKGSENLLLGFVFLLMFFFLQPCLCASREKSRRILCICEFKEAFRVLQSNGPCLPENFEVKQRKKCAHAVIYSGSGQSLRCKDRFILLEDAPRSHAGDLRHRLWSDGKIENFYPWKEKTP